MSNLKSLLIRINSIKSTKKITKVMQMIAASKLRAAQSELYNSRIFADQILDSVCRTVIQSDFNLDVFSNAEGIKIYIIISSNKGLCGGYNSALLKFFNSEVPSFESDNHFIFFGRKAYDLLKNKVSSKNLTVIHEEPDFIKVKSVVNSLHDKFQIKSCKIFYTKFKSSVSLVPSFIETLPASRFISCKDKHEILNNSIKFEPNAEVVLQDLIKKYQYAKLYEALKESAASEHMSRMIAMDSATKNAQDAVDDLSLQYNSSRQDKITRELIEIISGAEAL